MTQHWGAQIWFRGPAGPACPRCSPWWQPQGGPAGDTAPLQPAPEGHTWSCCTHHAPHAHGDPNPGEIPQESKGCRASGLHLLQPYLLLSLQPHMLNSPPQGPRLLALPVLVALLASVFLLRPGGQGAGSERDGAPCVGNDSCLLWDLAEHVPPRSGTAPEDIPLPCLKGHHYLSACTGRKKRKEGKEQPQAGAAGRSGLRGSCRH